MLTQLTRKPIPTDEIQPMIRKLIDGIVQRTSPEEIILFGSLARNEFTDGSDIDVIVLFSDAETMKTGKRNLYSERPLIDWPVDYLFYTRNEYDRRKEIGGGLHDR